MNGDDPAYIGGHEDDTWPRSGTSSNLMRARSRQPDGAELMIWLNHNGPVRPFGSRVGTAACGGRSYHVWFGKQAWKTISYSMVTTTTSVRDPDIGQFAADALRRGLRVPIR